MATKFKEQIKKFKKVYSMPPVIRTEATSFGKEMFIVINICLPNDSIVSSAAGFTTAGFGQKIDHLIEEAFDRLDLE
jgi:hypothetical protein